MSDWHGIRWAGPLAALTMGCSGALPPESKTAVSPPERPSASDPAPPTVRAAPPFGYEPGALRDPFQPPRSEWHGDVDHRRPLAPDLQRARTALEGFAMEELRMVGTLAAAGVRSALVRDPVGQVHAVRVGDYLGRDFGRVETIDDAGMVLLEAIADGSGDWVRRARVLPLHRPETGPRQPSTERRGDA